MVYRSVVRFGPAMYIDQLGGELRWAAAQEVQGRGRLRVPNRPHADRGCTRSPPGRGALPSSTSTLCPRPANPFNMALDQRALAGLGSRRRRACAQTASGTQCHRVARGRKAEQDAVVGVFGPTAGKSSLHDQVSIVRPTRRLIFQAAASASDGPTPKASGPTPASHPRKRSSACASEPNARLSWAASPSASGE